MTLPSPRPADPVGGDPGEAFEQALAGLEGLADRPLDEHVAVFERIHAALQDALAAGSGAGETAGRA